MFCIAMNMAGLLKILCGLGRKTTIIHTILSEMHPHYNYPRPVICGKPALIITTQNIFTPQSNNIIHN